MEEKKNEVHNHFEAGSNCQVFNGDIVGGVFAMSGSTVNNYPPTAAKEGAGDGGQTASRRGGGEAPTPCPNGVSAVADPSLAAGFSIQDILDYVGQIDMGNELSNKQMELFWATLIGRHQELLHMSYHQQQCCFVPARNEKGVRFSKVFVCSVIGYLRNKGIYPQTALELSVALGEGDEVDNARIKNMQQGLRDYDSRVVAVINKVISSVFGIS